MRIAQFLKSLFASFLILSLVACAPTATSEGTGEYVDDSVITTKVKAALASDPDVKATEVNVETFKGVVQLSGFVSSPEAAQKAVSLTRAVQGVREVKNNTVVKTAVAK
ncbi:MAG: BON domain-containing protein [Telluria sp.]